MHSIRGTRALLEPSARLASRLFQSRHKAEACKARTPAVRLCVVLQNVCLVRMITRVMSNVVKAWVLFR